MISGWLSAWATRANCNLPNKIRDALGVFAQAVLSGIYQVSVN
jgi:hypothetical protein